MPLLSIIISVDKAEDYITSCCENLLSQNFTSFEAIFIDETSSNSTTQLLRPYLEKYSNFTYHQLSKNDSISAKLAAGEYILFLKPCDTLAKGCLKEISRLIRTSKADIIQYAVQHFEGGLDTVFSKNCKGVEVFKNLMLKNTYISWKIEGKVYKKNLYFKAAAYTQGLDVFKDGGFLLNYTAAFFAQSFIYTKKAVYQCGQSRKIRLDTQATWEAWKVQHLTTKKALKDFKIKQGISNLAKNEEYYLYLAVKEYMDNQSRENQSLRFAELCQTLGAASVFNILSRYYPREKVLHLIPPQHPRSAKSIKTIAIIGEKSHSGGVERVTSLLLPALQRLGYKIILLTEQPPSPDDFPLPECLVRITMGQQRYTDIENALIEYAVDAVILQDYWRQETCWDLLYLAMRKDIFVIHNLHSMPLWADFTAFNERPIYESFYKCASIITVLSRNDKAYLQQKYPLSIFYMPNFLTFEPKNLPSASLEKPSIIVIGRLDPNKKPLTALHAFSIIKQDCPEASLSFAGTGPLENPLKAEAKNLGLESCVHFLGQVSNISSLLRESSLLMMPSCFEGYPMVIGEALAHGVPVVINQLEYLECASWLGVLMFEKDDASSLAQQALKLLNNKSLLKKTGSEGRIFIESLKNEDIEQRWSLLLQGLASGDFSAYPLDAAPLSEDEIQNLYRKEYEYALSIRSYSSSPQISKQPLSIFQKLNAVKKSIIQYPQYIIDYPPLQKIFLKLKKHGNHSEQQNGN